MGNQVEAGKRRPEISWPRWGIEINITIMNTVLYNHSIRLASLVCVLALFSVGCKNSSAPKTAETKETPVIQSPAFSADSAWSYIDKQVQFGPRVPGTPAQVACADWLVGKFKSFGAQVIVQQATVKVFNGQSVPMKNIIAQFQPEKSNRIMLMAHWDSRPFADQDSDPAKRETPIDGANDGASGVGVLLEIARALQNQPTTLGIDLILFDVEDYGAPENSQVESKPEFWCLGSQYWAHHPHTTGYFARYGILLDMVGAPDAVFTLEEVSCYYAQSVVDKVWAAGNQLGYGKYFSYQKTPQLIDDHRFINQIIGIPSIDIVQNDASTQSSFGAYWHTHSDNMSNISRATLSAVGSTLLKVVYAER